MQEVSFRDRSSQIQLRMDASIEASQQARNKPEPKLSLLEIVKNAVSKFFNYTVTTFSPSHREEQRKMQLSAFFDAVKNITNPRIIIRG